MHSLQESVLIGARIPNELKKTLSEYCLNHGVKMNYFVTEAIKEKLLEVIEDNSDMAIAKRRLSDAEFVSAEEFNKYLLKRGISA